MDTYTLKSSNRFTTAVNLWMGAPPMNEEVRELARAYRIRVEDLRQGLVNEKDGEPVWGHTQARLRFEVQDSWSLSRFSPIGRRTSTGAASRIRRGPPECRRR